MEQTPGGPASPPAPPPRPPADHWRPFTEPWLAWWEASARNWNQLVALSLFTEPRPVRTAWLAELTRSTDRYLRSPPFLELIRTNLALVAGSTEAFFPDRSK